MDRQSPGDAHGMDYGDYLELVNKHLRAMVVLEDAQTIDQLVERFDEGMLSQVLEMLQHVQAVLHLARRELRRDPGS